MLGWKNGCENRPKWFNFFVCILTTQDQLSLLKNLIEVERNSKRCFSSSVFFGHFFPNICLFLSSRFVLKPEQSLRTERHRRAASPPTTVPSPLSCCHRRRRRCLCLCHSPASQIDSEQHETSNIDIDNHIVSVVHVVVAQQQQQQPGVYIPTLPFPSSTTTTT